MTHAGFWVDGAVRKPEARHADREGCVSVKWKNNPMSELDCALRGFRDWSEVYWLDTTPRESLTPEELLSVVKAIWPSVETVHKHNDASWYVDEIESGVKVDWGNLTQYPPPVEPQWIRITRENVGQYLFRECRCKDVEFESWEAGRVVGWDLEDECCLVDGSTVERVMKYDFVEVQNAPAS